MRIERLHIEGFGHYHEREIGPFDESLTLVKGRNEAGKSTMLAFMRAVLFGFPTRLGAQHYPPLRGGRHGGRIALSLDDGRAFTAERVQGRGPGPFQARGSDGEVLDEAGFAPLIGHASETLFRSAFTFDLDDLPAFDATDGDLGGLLYGVSMGAEQLPQAMSRLDARIDDLFRPGGSNQAVAHLLRELEENEAQLREVAGQADNYRRLAERREQIAEELEAAQACLAQIDARRQRRERQRRAWEDWTKLQFHRERLAGLEETEGFPANGVERLEQAEEAVRVAVAAHEDAARELDEAREAANAPIPDAALLHCAEAIETLRRGRGAVDGSLGDLPERQAELRAREEELGRLLAELGPGWDESRLFAFDLSIPRRGEIERRQRRFDELRAAQRDRERDRDEARRARDDAAEALRQAGALLEPLADAPGREAVHARAERLRLVRARHGTYEYARRRLGDLEAQQRPPVEEVVNEVGRLPAMLAVAGVLLVAGAGGAVAVDWSWLAVLLGIGGAAALAASGALALAGRQAPNLAADAPAIEQMRQRAQADLDRAEIELREAAAAVPEMRDVSVIEATAIDAAEAALERDRLRAEERRRAEERVAELGRQIERTVRRLEEAEAARAAAGDALNEAEREWERWLAGADLPAGLAPETADVLLNRVQFARTKAEEAHQWRHRVQAIREDIQQYRSRVEPVAEALGIDTAFADDRAAAEAADAIIARFETARREAGGREQACVTVEERGRACERAERRLSEAREMVANLLEAGGVATAEEFRGRAAAHEERRALERERDECEMRLRQASGGDAEALEALDRSLRQTTLEEIEAELRALEAQQVEAQARRDGLIDERGRLTSEIEQLHGDVAASEARARAAMLGAELGAVAREWSSLVVARALLRRTRERYERERQPQVIRRASDFFCTLTGGRYERLYQPIGESTVTVVDRDGAAKTPEQLSRGTREQLYLALRLGAIEEAARSHERLPVIVDEVLVNFDPVRARYAAEAFARLAQHTQVIVFTCHPWIAELFEGACTRPRVIELG